MNARTDPVLHLRDVQVAFGGNQVLRGVDLRIDEGEICGLVGPNGSGKSTLLNVASRLVDPSAGQVGYLGRDVTRWPAHRVSRAGLRRTFQNMRFIEDATALDNVLASLYCDRTLRRKLPRRPRDILPRLRPETEAARELLATVGAAEFADWRVSALSHGSRRKVDLARGLIGAPRMLLLDEATSGVSQAHTALMRACIEGEAAHGTSVLLVDHDLEFVEQVCHRVVVLDAGAVIFDGGPADALRAPAVIAAYLGSERAARRQ
jgi:branched-chain amino acid transport system ATP-binding protein